MQHTIAGYNQVARIVAVGDTGVVLLEDIAEHWIRLDILEQSLPWHKRLADCRNHFDLDSLRLDSSVVRNYY